MAGLAGSLHERSRGPTISDLPTAAWLRPAGCGGLAPEGSSGTVGTPSICYRPAPHFQAQVAAQPPLSPTRLVGLLRSLSKVPFVPVSCLKLSPCGLGLCSKCPAASPVPSSPLLPPSALFFELICLFGHASRHMDLSAPARDQDQTRAPVVRAQS